MRGVGAQRITHTPRRARCGDCGRTQILLPTELTVRRADTTEAIGNALVAKANGAGTAPSPWAWIARHRPCAAGSAAPAAHTPSGCTSKACRRSWPSIRDLLTGLAPQRTPLGWALNTLISAAVAYRQVLGLTDPLWSLIGSFTRGAADRTESADLKSGPALSLRARSRPSPCRRTLHRSPRPASLRDDRRHRADQTRDTHPHSQ